MYVCWLIFNAKTFKLIFSYEYRGALGSTLRVEMRSPFTLSANFTVLLPALRGRPTLGGIASLHFWQPLRWRSMGCPSPPLPSLERERESGPRSLTLSTLSLYDMISSQKVTMASHDLSSPTILVKIVGKEWYLEGSFNHRKLWWHGWNRVAQLVNNSFYSKLVTKIPVICTLNLV